jgi:hypothetical protein
MISQNVWTQLTRVVTPQDIVAVSWRLRIDPAEPTNGHVEARICAKNVEVTNAAATFLGPLHFDGRRRWVFQVKATTDG